MVSMSLQTAQPPRSNTVIYLMQFNIKLPLHFINDRSLNTKKEGQKKRTFEQTDFSVKSDKDGRFSCLRDEYTERERERAREK